MTLNHNCGCFSTVAGIAGNVPWLYFSSGKVKNYLSVMPKVYKYTLIFDLRPKPLLNKTTVNISCGLLNEILTLFIFLLRLLYVTLSYNIKT